MQNFSVINESELADFIRGRDAPLEIVGRGTKRGFGKPFDADILDASAFSGIISYEPDELVITARAATPVSEIEAVISEKHQRLGFDPADWGPLFGAKENNGTIAGALSADTSGSARVRFGAARDHLLGFGAVNGLGEIYKTGGRVVKNVTGFDLPKLVCGAMGTLGVLTEVTLRLVPKAPVAITLAVNNLSHADGLALLRRVWGTPLEATGLAYIPDGDTGTAYIRLEGAATPLKEKISALRNLAHDAREIDDEENIFRGIGAGADFINTDFDIWRIAIPPSQAANVIAAIAPPLWRADWAGGMLWIGMKEGPDLHAIAARVGGHATLLRASAETRARIPVFPPQDETKAALTRAVKAAFDPKNIFNPGRMG